MATRSYVGIIQPKDPKSKENLRTIKYIYVHWDGSPKKRLPILTENYTTADKVNALIDLGNLSQLEPSIEKPDGHTYDTPVDGYTIAYGRDRGETGTKAQTAYYNPDKKMYLGMDKSEYVYLFDTERNEWVYFNPAN